MLALLTIYFPKMSDKIDTNRSNSIVELSIQSLTLANLLFQALTLIAYYVHKLLFLLDERAHNRIMSTILGC